MIAMRYLHPVALDPVPDRLARRQAEVAAFAAWQERERLKHRALAAAFRLAAMLWPVEGAR